MSDEEFRRLAEFLYRRTGIIFAESKRYYVDRRLADRIVATGSGSFQAYFANLRTHADRELEFLINSLTVNETYFFREEHQLRCLGTSLLEHILPRKRIGQPIRIWSVPCSTGEEPYSIAIWLLENWPQVDDHEVEIIGSDIDTGVLKKAEAGIYGRRALMRLSPELIERYFEPIGSGEFRIDAGLRESIRFTAANLVDAASMREQERFDVIYCRNVLIYFDDTSRRLAAENLYDCLNPGGFVCLGHTESMSRISSLFRVCRYTDAIVYQRPDEGRDA